MRKYVKIRTNKRRESKETPAPKKGASWKAALMNQAQQPQGIIIGGVLLASVMVIGAETWLSANEPEPTIASALGQEESELNLLPLDMELMFDPGKEGEKAAEQALSHYSSGSLPRLSLIDQDMLIELTGRDNPVAEAPIQTANEIAVTLSSESSSSPSSLPHLGLLNRVDREQARALGLYGPQQLRPGAIEGAVHLGKFMAAQTTFKDMSEADIQQAQAVFRESNRFQRLVSSIGERVGQHWVQPRQRSVPDGAVIELSLTAYGELTDANIERSTGNAQYDDTVLAAAHAAAPFYELNGLEPWLRPVLMGTHLTFGNPPLTPEEHRRRRDEGTLHSQEVSEDDIDSIREMLAGNRATDHYDAIRQMVENEFLAMSPSSFSPDNDAIMHVEVSPELGVVMSITTERGSGDPRFDEAARSAIDAAAPFRGMRRISPIESQRLARFKLHFHESGVR